MYTENLMTYLDDRIDINSQGDTSITPIQIEGGFLQKHCDERNMRTKMVYIRVDQGRMYLSMA